MSFKWKCDCCNTDIIVPYKSPETMMGNASAYCNKCFKKIEHCDQTGEFYQTEDENGKMINAYMDIMGMAFECKNAD